MAQQRYSLVDHEVGPSLEITKEIHLCVKSSRIFDNQQMRLQSHAWCTVQFMHPDAAGHTKPITEERLDLKDIDKMIFELQRIRNVVIDHSKVYNLVPVDQQKQ